MTREQLHSMTKAQAIRHFRADAARIVNNIDLSFNTAGYWNNSVRKPDELPIDPDPDGDMARMKAHLLGHIAQLDARAAQEARSIRELERIAGEEER